MFEQNKFYPLQSRNVRETAEEEEWIETEGLWGEERKWVADIEYKEVCG